MSKGAKVWLIIAGTLVLIGCMIFGGVMMRLNWNFLRLSTNRHVTNEYKITQEYKSVSVATDTADILFAPSETAETTVVCHEREGELHSVMVREGILEITLDDTRKWYEHIGISFGSTKITVYLPQKEFESIAVKTTTGDIQLEDLSANALELNVSTGKIEATDIACKGDLQVAVSTGDAILKNITCQNLISRGNTGKLSLNRVIAKGRFDLERSTGDLYFDGCDAAEIFSVTDTGDVRGTLLTDKVFMAQSDTGRIEVPKSVNGGRCEITTDTGDIKISVQG